MDTIAELIGAYPARIAPALFAIFLSWFIWICASCKGLLTQIRKSETQLNALADGRAASTEIAQHVQKSQIDRIAPDGSSSSLIVIDRRLYEVLHEHVAAYFRRPRFLLGATATGIALSFTFILIGLVLKSGIRNAIQLGVAGQSSLADAVGALGEKFYISVVGIFFATLSTAAVAIMRRKIEEACEKVAGAVSERFVTRETMDLRVQLRQQQLIEQLVSAQNTTSTHAEKAQMLAVEWLQDISKKVGAQSERAAESVRTIGEKLDAHSQRAADDSQRLTSKLAKLESMDVSLKGLSSEVEHGLRRMVTHELVHGLRTMMAETLSEALEKATSGLTSEMRATIEKEIPAISAALEAIRVSIENQAAAPVEKMLEQIERIVSGGIKGETAQLSDALQQFAQTIPALEAQVKNVLAGMPDAIVGFSTELSQQLTNFSAQLRDVSEHATQRVLEINGGALENQRAQVGRVLRTLSESMQSEVTGFSQTLAEAGSRALATATDDAHRKVGQFLEDLAAGVDRAAVSCRDFVVNAGDCALDIDKSRAAFEAVSNNVAEVGSHLTAVVKAVEGGVTQIDAVATRMGQTAESLLVGIEGSREIVALAATSAAHHDAAMRRQSEYVSKAQTILPEVFNSFVGNYAQQAKQVESSWDSFFEKVAQLNQASGGNLQETIDRLTTAVKDLSRASEVRRTA